MLPLSLPMLSPFCQAPDPINEDDFATKARTALEAKEQKNRDMMTRIHQRPMTNFGQQQKPTTEDPEVPLPETTGAEETTAAGRRRSSVAMPTHRRRFTQVPDAIGQYTVEDFPFLNWGQEVAAVNIKETDFVLGLAITPVLDRKLVKLGILAARSVICIQHPDLIVPEVLLADYGSAGSGCVLMCEERSRSSNLGIQADIMPQQRDKALEVLSLELNLDLSNFFAQVPAPCYLHAADTWDTLAVRSALNAASKQRKQKGGRRERGHRKSKDIVMDEESDDSDAEDHQGDEGHSDQSTSSYPVVSSRIAQMLKGSRVEPLQLLRKLLNTTEDPEGPIERVFPNPKRVSQRYVTVISNSVHLLPAMYPIGIRTFGDFLTKRFRPEFVRDYGGPPLLSTACYASCPIGQTNQAKERLFRATLHLFNVVIPRCAKSIDVEATPLHGEDLCNRMHMFGVNLRFLGWLLPWITRTEVTRAILTEITARSYKVIEEQRDRTRHAKLMEALKSAHNGGTGGPPPTPSQDADEEVEFSELTRVAVNRYYPPHLWVPLPKFLPSERLLLQRMHPRYGVLVDVLETWEEDARDGGSVDGGSDNASHGAAGFCPSVLPPEVIDGIDFGLELDQQTCPPTPKVEVAFEFDPVLYPSVIDSEVVESRILELVRRQRFVFLPGRFPVLSREHYLTITSSSALELYMTHLQESVALREEAAWAAAAAAASQRGSALDITAAASTSSDVLMSGSGSSSGLSQLPFTIPLLKAAAQVAFCLRPFEVSMHSSDSGAYFLHKAMHMIKMMISGTTSRGPGSNSVQGGPTYRVLDSAYWYCSTLLAESKYYYAAERDDASIASCNEGLQYTTNPRLRMVLLLVQMQAQLRRCLKPATIASTGPPALKLLTATSPTAQEGDGKLELLGALSSTGDSDETTPPLTSPPAVGGALSVISPRHSEALERESIDSWNASLSGIEENEQLRDSVLSTAGYVQPLILDLLKTIPAAVPPKHAVRDSLYMQLLRTMEKFVDREVISSAMVQLSPSSSSVSSNLKGGGASVTNVSVAEGAAKEEIGLIVVERNFAGNGIPFEVLGQLKQQRDSYMEMTTVCPHFVSPNASYFNFEDSKFPDPVAEREPGSTMGHSSADVGDAPSASSSLTKFCDAMTLIDAFLSPDREGLRDLEDKNILLFTCPTSKTCIAYETVKNIVEMRKMNCHSLLHHAFVDPAVGQGASLQATPDDVDLVRAKPSPSDLSLGKNTPPPPAALSSTTSSQRQVSIHAQLWSVEKKSAVTISNAPTLPLCSLLPIIVDCRHAEPYDNQFVSRVIPRVSENHLRLLSQNPKLVLVLDGFNPRLPMTWSGHYNLFSWASKKIVLIDNASLTGLTPSELYEHMFPTEVRHHHHELQVNAAAAIGYALMPLSEAQIGKLLQRLELNRWDGFYSVLRFPLLLRRNANPTIMTRWYALKSCGQRLLFLMRHPQLATMLGAAVALMAPQLHNQRKLTTVDALDALLYTHYLVFEGEVSMQADAVLYGITLATLMTQTNTMHVKREPQAQLYQHCLPIQFLADGRSVSFSHPIFVSYFLSLRCTLELLESEDNPGKCMSNPYSKEIFTPVLAQNLKRSALRRSKSMLASDVLQHFMKDKGQATVLKAAAKFSESRKKKLNGGEWLTRKELSLESDTMLIDFLADRCTTVPAVSESLLFFSLRYKPSADARMIISNAITILVRAKISLSGRNFRGLDLSSATLNGCTAVALDARCTKWGFASARNSNFAFADFTSADFRSFDIGSEPRMQLLHRHATITSISFPAAENDVVFTGDDAGHVSRWRMDTGQAQRTVNVGAPVGKVCVNALSTFLAVSRATTDALIDIRDTVTLKKIAVLSGHTARVTNICFLGDVQLVSSSFDWQVFVWELPDEIIVTKTKPEDAASLPNDATQNSTRSERKLSTAEQIAETRSTRQVSPKRQGRLHPIAQLVSTNNSAPAKLSGGSSGGAVIANRRLLPTDVLSAANSVTWSRKRPLQGANASMEGSIISTASSKQMWYEVLPCYTARRHTVHITALDASNNTRLIAILGGDGKGLIFPVVGAPKTSGEITFCSEEVRGAPCIRFTEDGAKLAIPTTRGCTLIDATSGRQLLTLTYPSSTSCIPQCIDISIDGSLVAASCDRTVCMWDAVTGFFLGETKPFHEQPDPATPSSMLTLSQALVATAGFTRRGKALLTTYWGGGMKVTPLLFSEQRDKIFTDDSQANITTSEYRWVFCVNRGLHLAGIGFNGNIEVLDAETGSMLGSCGRVINDEIRLAAGDQSSDLVAVACQPVIHVFSLFRRIPPRVLPWLSKQLTAIAFAPPPLSGTASSGCGGVLVACGLDRSVRVWDCESGVIMQMIILDSPISFLSSGHRKLVALTGFAASRSLGIATVTIQVFPSLNTTASKSKLGAAGAMYLTAEGDMILPLQRTLLLCARRKYSGLPHFGDVTQLLCHSVFPFLRRHADVRLHTLNNCILRIPSKDAVIRCAIGGPKDSIAAISFDTMLAVFDVNKDELVRTQEVHPQLITSVDVSPETLSWKRGVAADGGGLETLIATGCSDGGTTVTVASSGSRLVELRPNEQKSMWCVRFLRRGSNGTDPLLHQDGSGTIPRNHTLLTAGSDCVLRRWNLEGAACVVGTIHPISQLGSAGLMEWLASHGLSCLKGLLAGKVGSDVMDPTPEAMVAMLTPMLPPPPPPPGGHPSFGSQMKMSRMIQQRKSSIMLLGSPTAKSERRASTVILSPIREPSSLLSSPIASRRGSLMVSPAVGGGNTPSDNHRPTTASTETPPSALDVEKLRNVLRRAREQSYDTLNCSAMDDAELTAEQFDTFTPEQVASFLDYHAQLVPQHTILTAGSSLVMDRKITGEVLRSKKTISEVKMLLEQGTSTDEMAKQLFHEVQLVRNSRLRDAFAEKSVAEVVLFARSKSPGAQFLFLILNLNGRELLEKTQFSNQLVLMCPDCGRRIADARMTCPVRRGNHTHLNPQYDQESISGMSKLNNMFRENMNSLAEAMLDVVHNLPDKVKFSCGMWWHPMLHDPGFISVLYFHVPQLSEAAETVINTATISITSTDKNPPRLVVIDEEHPKQLQKMAGIKSSIGDPSRMAAVGFPCPPGWKRSGEAIRGGDGASQADFGGSMSGSVSFSSPGGAQRGSLSVGSGGRSVVGGDAGYKYHFNDHVQSIHPAMPTSMDALNPADVMAAQTTCERLTMQLANSIPNAKPPSAHHRFKKSHSSSLESPAESSAPLFSLLGDHLAAAVSPNMVMADVKDIVQAAVNKKDKIIRVLVVCEAVQDSRELVAPACRPVLTINYYDENKLCACKSRCSWFPFRPPPPRNLRPGDAPPPIRMGDGFIPFVTQGALATPNSSFFAREVNTAAEYFTGTLLCDRLCNVKSECRGHKCPSASSACRRAPYLVWETREMKGGCFYRTRINGVTGLSSANATHMAEFERLPAAGDAERKQHRVAGNAIGSSDGGAATSTPPTGGSGNVLAGRVSPPPSSALLPPAMASLQEQEAFQNTSITSNNAVGGPSQRKRQVTITSFDDAIQQHGLKE